MTTPSEPRLDFVQCLDGRGLPLLATVHYGRRYDNAFWDGTRMVFGDGDGVVFLGFTRSLDVIGHELAHGVTQYTSGLNYQGQSGALNESVSDVFGVLVTQFARRQTAAEADWLVGADLLGPDVRDRGVEAENPPVQRSRETSEPRLQRLPVAPLLAAHPVGELSENHRAGVAVVLFSLEPSHHAWVAVALGGLTQDIRIQQPAHNFDRKYSRRRGRRSSMGTGQALSTFNHFGLDAMRRHNKASSSASKSTRK